MPYTASMPSAIITINYQDLVVGIPFGPLLYGCKSLVLPSFAYIIGVDLMKSVLKMTYWCEGIILPFSKYKRFDLVPIASLFAFEKYLVSLTTSAKIKLNFVFVCSHVLRKIYDKNNKENKKLQSVFTLLLPCRRSSTCLSYRSPLSRPAFVSDGKVIYGEVL